MTSPTYVLVTPAHNEARFIGQTIECMLAQRVLPRRWVIVSDASTDGTDEIIAAYAERHSCIRLCRLTTPHSRNFASKLQAIQLGCEELAGVSYEYIGNLDADVSLDRTYFGQLLQRFGDMPRLGLAAGVVREE